MKNQKKQSFKPLGKGLDDLLGPLSQNLNSVPSKKIIDLDLSLISPNINQPRSVFNKEELQQLSISLKEHGIIQPIVVRKKKDTNVFSIIAGERRWRAAKMLNWQTIPSIVKDVDDSETYQLAIIENIQRSNLSTLEEAQAYKNLIIQYNCTQEEISEKMGKSRSYITNMIRLLTLSPKGQEYLNSKIITGGHARAILGFDHKQMDEIIEKIVNEQLNVRQTEKLISSLTQSQYKKNKTLRKYESKNIDSNNTWKNFLPENFEEIITNHVNSEDIEQLESTINKGVGLESKIFVNNQEGFVNIHFNNFEELDMLVSLLNKNKLNNS